MLQQIGKRYDLFREGVVRWGRSAFGQPGERVACYLFLLPDLVRLQIRLLSDTRVFLLDKIFVAGVLVYIISPVDLIPEVIAGPFGLFEDVLLAVLVLYRLLGNPANADAIWEHWNGDRQILLRLQGWCQSLRRFFQRPRR